MDYLNPTLQSLLRALVSGRDTGHAVDVFVADQLHKVACKILSVANEMNTEDTIVSAPLRYRDRHSDETDKLLTVFANTISKRLGKILEIPLFGTIARLHQVPDAHYTVLGMPEKPGEAVFSFVNRQGAELACEFQFSNTVESECAGPAFSHDSTIVLVDTFSEAVKRELHLQRKHWVELGAAEGYKRMFTVFTYLDIPCSEFDGDLDTALDAIIPAVFEEIG